MRHRADGFCATYEIEDGYAGGARPQRFAVRPDDIEEDMSEGDLRDLLIEMAEEDMRQKTNVAISDRDFESFLEWARKVQAEREAEASYDRD